MRPCSPVPGLACVVLAGCYLLLQGCQGSVFLGRSIPEDVWAAEGFSYGLVGQDGLVIGGVTSVVSELDPAEEALHAALFRDILQLGDEAPQVRGTGELLQCLGPERWAELVGEYRSDGTIGPGPLGKLAGCGIGDRYLLLARVTRDEVKQHERKDFSKEGWYRRRTTRSVAVAAHVFDLTAGALVWTAQAHNWEEREHSYPEQEDTGAVKALIDLVLGTDEKREPEYPAAPETEFVFRPVYLGLARELKKA